MLQRLFGQLRRFSSRASSAGIDLYYRIETRRPVSVEALGTPAEFSHSYSAVEWFSLPRILKTLNVGTSDVFLDLGCGKGRALLIASRFPFRKIIGIELADTLATQARANCATYLKRRGARCREIEVLQGDAAEYNIPPEVTVVFLFSPFRDLPFNRVLENLRESVAMAPRHVRVVYHAPALHDQVMQLLGEGVRLTLDRSDYKVYELGVATI